MKERQDTELRITLDVLKPLAHDLREHGYDASLWVEARGDHYAAEIRVRIPALGVPIETTEEDDGA